MTQLTWAVAWMLRSDARVVERVRREADEVLGGVVPAEVTGEHVARLKYTSAVLRYAHEHEHERERERERERV